MGTGKWAVDMKAGGAWQRVTDDWYFPVYPTGLMIYVTDTRVLPLLYVDASGSGESTIRLGPRRPIEDGCGRTGLGHSQTASLNLQKIRRLRPAPAAAGQTAA